MLKLFLTFLKLGTFIFGSGHALVNAMQDEIVDKQQWLTLDQFQSGWASANILPGPIATKVVAYVGYQQAGVFGAALAVTAYLIPSISGMTLLGAALAHGADDRPLFVALKSAVRGLKPAVLALLADAFLSFSGVAIPRGAGLVANAAPFAVVMAGVAVCLAGMWRLSRASGVGGKYVLSDPRAVGIFVLAMVALLVFRIDAIYVMLAAAAIGLTYLAV
jgi:chromate transporter